MRKLLFALIIVFITCEVPIYPSEGVLDIEKAIIRCEYSYALKLGEKELSKYKSKRPPLQLYKDLFISYLELGDIKTATDILRLMQEEYGFKGEEYEFFNKKLLAFSNYETKQLFLQVGAFKNRKNADRLKKELTKNGMDCFVSKRDGFYKVIVKCKEDNFYIVKAKLNSLGIKFRRLK